VIPDNDIIAKKRRDLLKASGPKSNPDSEEESSTKFEQQNIESQTDKNIKNHFRYKNLQNVKDFKDVKAGLMSKTKGLQNAKNDFINKNTQIKKLFEKSKLIHDKIMDSGLLDKYIDYSGDYSPGPKEDYTPIFKNTSVVKNKTQSGRY